MEKIGCAFGILVFIFVTMLVMFTDIADFEHTVTFSNQNLAFNQQQKSNVENVTTPVKNTEQKISNQTISYGTTNFDLETNELNSSNINFENTGSLNNQQNRLSNQGSLSNEGSFNNQQNRLSNQGSLSNEGSFNIKQSDINNLKTGFKNYGNYSNKKIKYNNNNTSVKNYNNNVNNANINNENYALKNIDWNTWRSNFVNKITDDTFYIEELNKYPTGTLFHYSFAVDNTGRVYNVKITSLTISKEDRDKIAELIKGYSYTDITKFPPNSKRKTANVSAILLFSNETEYSSPSDFHDLEQIKIKL